MKRFWVAHVRGAEFPRLVKLGFLVFYPEIDDYVFLEVKDENEKLLRKQNEFGVHFLRKKKVLATVTEREIQQMKKETKDELLPETEVEVVSGYAANMKGKVVEVLEGKYRCLLNGWRRTYEVLLERTDLAVRGTLREQSITG